MTNQVPRYVTRAGASLLLGMTEAELSRIAKESRLGRSERAGDQEETYFTYEELQRIRTVATSQVQTAAGNCMEISQAEPTSSGPLRGFDKREPSVASFNEDSDIDRA